MIEHILAGIGVLALIALIGAIALYIAVARGWNPFK